MQVRRRHPAFVWLLALFSLAAPAIGQTPAPRIDVRIERIDTGRYPDLDIYFRVLDTDPTTDIHRLIPADVTLFEGPRDGALAPAAIASNNFAMPQLRPLATGVALDKSGSVDDVIQFILSAITDFAALMKNADANTYRPTDPTRGMPDTTWAMAFSGSALIELGRTIDYTPDIAAIQAWANSNIRAGGFSPIWAGLDAAVTATALQSYDQPDASRIVFLISDGINNRGYPEAPGDLQPDRALRNAQGTRIRCYSLAMSFVNERGVVAGDINRPMMQRVAADTGGVYFEPRSPFPVVPAAPEPPDGNLDAVAGAGVAGPYLQIGLGTTANFARTQAKTGPLPADVQGVVTKTLGGTGGTTTTAAPTNYEGLVDRFRPNAAPPTLTNTDQVTYRELAAVQSSMVELARLEVTVTDLQRRDYYRDQVRNIMAKIQAAEKTIYRVTHTVQDERYDGSLRNLRLQVQYSSAVNGVVTPLQAGTATGTYRSPQLLTEDKAEAAPFPVDTTIPQVALTLGNRNPRGGDWTGPLAVKMTTRLVTEIPNRDGTPPTLVTVARMGADGAYTPMEPPASLPNLVAVKKHIAAESGDYESLLRSIRATGDFDAGSGTLALTLSPKTPTAVKNQTDPVKRPVANVTEPDNPRLIHYEVDFEAERPYSYQTNIPPTTTLRTVNTASKFALPSMVFYVGDFTPPTLGIYLTPSGRSTAMIAVRPQAASVDQPPPQAQKVALLGDDIGVPVEPVKTLINGFVSAPYEFDGGGSTPGFVVNERIEIRVQVFAKDNFDRNRDHRYLLAATPGLPDTDTWTQETRDRADAKGQAPPYLGRQPWDELGRLDPATGNARSGFSYRFEEAGVNDDNQADRKIFRAANVELIGTDSFKIIAGQEIFLTVKGADASGNATQVRIPVLVTPVGINVDRLRTERERK